MIAELRSQRQSRLLLNLVALCLLGAGATSARGQLLYSFESDTPPLDGWTAATATIVPSTTLGVTDGTKSMLIDNLGPNFNNDVGVRTQGAGSGTAFTYFDDAALAIAAGNTNVKLEFDFSWDHAATIPAWAQLGIFVNSTGAGFRQYGTGALIGGNINGSEPDVFPRLAAPAIADGVTLAVLGPNSIHLAIPMNPTVATDADGLNIGSGPAGTNFYQMGFKSNGGWGGTVDWAIDNIRISGVQVPTTSETIFSWETPDNPGTPAVDERFEGWQEGGLGANPPHDHSIVMTGATDGTHALQIDRTANPSGFTWGSTFVLNSDTDPGPGQTIDPVIQAQIDNLIGKISAADRVAFDVTYQYQDLFPLPNPTFTGFGVHFADETGRQFQAFGDNLNVTGATNPTTTTIEIPLSEFVDFTDNNLTLTNTGLMAGSDYLRIAISTNTDGAQIYQVDNFRLVTEVSQGVPGDYNNNGVVDGADYVLWRNGGPLQNEVDTPGTVNAADYTEWRARFGNTSGSGSLTGGAVPEPSAAALLIAAIVGSLIATRRTCRPFER
jgi:hypothetical protein